LEVISYPDTTKLLGALSDDDNAVDIYLLDIEMQTPHEGLEFAHSLRQRTRDDPLVFVTSHRELAFDSFDVQALSFTGKPVSDPRNRARLLDALEQLLKQMQQRETIFFTFVINNNLRRMPLYEIIYFSTDARNSHYLLINGEEELRIRRRLSEIQNEFREVFLICHQSYMVNLEHLRAIYPGTLLLSNGIEVPISRAQLATVRQRFAAYNRGAQE